MIKRQDIQILATLMGGQYAKLSFAQLADKAKLSVSETFAAVRRLRDSSILNDARQINKHNVREFLFHALRYICPVRYGACNTSGLPAAYAAPIASAEFSIVGDIPVWPYTNGSAIGRCLEPIYPTAPVAAAADRTIYDNLAIIDMLRGGRLRERSFAMKKIDEIL